MMTTNQLNAGGGRCDQWLCFKSLLSAIAETFLISTWHAILKFFGWEQAAELAGALVRPHVYRDSFTIALMGH